MASFAWLLLALPWLTIACSDASRLEARLAAGDAHRAAGRVEQSLAEYQEALELDPNSLSAQLRIGSLYTAQGRLPEAIQVLEAAAKQHPDSAEAHRLWGDALLRRGRYAEAVRSYGRATDLDPDNPLPYRNAALALVLLRRDEEAIRNFEEAQRLGASLPASELVFWAAAYQHLGRVADAIRKYEAALRVDPSDTSAMNNLGVLLVGQKAQRSRGVQLLEKAVRLKPGDPNFLYNLGRAYQQLDRHEAATNLIQRAVAATRPSDASYASRLARLREAEAKLSRGAPPREAPNVLLVIIDTLRADHVGAYGYERNTTPTLDALSKQGVLFENAISQAPWTAASVATLFTGLYPSVHGLDGGIRWGAGQSSAGGSLPFAVQKVLGPSQRTLAEVLRRHGYHTAGFVSNVYMNSIFGFGQGFDRYDDEHADYSKNVARVKRRAEATNQRVFQWLAGGPEEPFFLLVHYNDPHWPYDPPAPYGRDYVAGYAGKLDPSHTFEAVNRQGKPATDLSEADLAYLVGLYDGEIAYADAQLRRLLQRLDATPLKRPLLTVVTSDHGEEFLDHGSTSHGYTLYEELIHVPLIVRAPGRLAPARIQAQVRALDVMPTLLELVGIDAAPEPVQGKSLVPLMRGQSRAAPGVALSEATFSEAGEVRSLRTDAGLKWIQRFDEDRAWMYDLGSDPKEQRDLAAARPGRAKQLQSELAQQMEANRSLRAKLQPKNGGIGDVILDEQTRERLKALGYGK